MALFFEDNIEDLKKLYDKWYSIVDDNNLSGTSDVIDPIQIIYWKRMEELE